MRCEVVAVGTELLLGQIVDTNSAWIGGQLALAGIDSHFQTKVGDNLGRIIGLHPPGARAQRCGHPVRRPRADPGRHHPRGDRRGHGRAAGAQRRDRAADPGAVRGARAGHGGEQPAPGGRPRRRSGDSADARHGAGADLPRRRQGDLRRPGGAARDADDAARHGAARPAAARRARRGDQEPGPAHLGPHRIGPRRAARGAHPGARWARQPDARVPG